MVVSLLRRNNGHVVAAPVDDGRRSVHVIISLYPPRRLTW